jgi:hypothetical protein
MPQYKNVREERVVTRDQLDDGYLERDGMTVRRRKWELIRQLPDGRYLVRAPEPEKPEAE